MICELCGRQMNDGFQVKVEGGVVTACQKCSGLGELVKKVSPGKKAKRAAVDVQKKAAVFEVEVSEELVEGCSSKIRKAREARGMKQEELARLVNEPESLVHRIESGRIEPSPVVARKLQKALGVRLLTLREESKEVRPQETISGPLTLGDVVSVKKRK